MSLTFMRQGYPDLSHAAYRLVYEIDGATVWVLALVHTARQWPLLA